MSAAPENTTSAALRRTSTRLPRPFWIGLAIVPPIIAAIAIFVSVKPPVPHFPHAALCISDADGHELAQAGLQDPQGPHVLLPGALKFSMQPKSIKFVEKHKGMRIQIKWRLLRSGAAADSYEFKITTGSQIVPMVKRVEVSSQPIDLLRGDNFVVTIEEKPVDEIPTTEARDE